LFSIQFAVFSASGLYVRGFTSFEERISTEVQVNASGSTLLNVTRLFGYWPWFTADYGAYYQIHYGSVLLLLVSALFPAIAFMSAFGRAKGRTYIFLFLSVVGIFLAKSINHPFGVINAYLYERVPYGWMFVNNFQNFTLLIALGYSVLLADGYKLCVANRPRLRITTATCIVLLVLVNSHPVILNQVYESSQTYQIPAYYADLRDWLITQGSDFKVLLLPEIQVYEFFEWGYSGPEVLQYFTGMAPLLIGASGLPYETLFVQKTFDSIRNNSSRFIHYARTMHVRYILLDNSLMTGYDAASSHEARMTLLETEGLSYLRSFGKVEVYEVEDWIPIVYVPQRICVLYGNLTSLPENVFANATQAFVLKKEVSSEMLKKLSNTGSATILSYERQNPCTFEVQLASQETFVLVLGVPYSEAWVAQIDGKPLSNHFLINGFANAWLIENPGIFSIEISYNPQKYVSYGFLLSLTSLVTMATMVMGSASARKKKAWMPYKRHYAWIQ